MTGIEGPVSGVPVIEVLVSYGGNVKPEANAVAAARQLAEVLDGLELSSAWRSSAVGCVDAPPFVNWVARGATTLGPTELKFDHLRRIERELGRQRTDNLNAPRTADLDLLLFGDLRIVDPNAGLVVPDPDLIAQPHLLVPAAEVAPEWVVPGEGKRLAELAAAASSEAMERLGSVLDLTPA